MLVLTRKVGESIVIGDGRNEVIVTVLSGNGRYGQHRIGINAPRHIPVHRQEIADRIKMEKNR